MKILVIGGGGREHALCWALAKSERVAALYCAPGNAGIAQVARCEPMDPADSAAVLALCRQRGIDLVVIGPEAPLVAGLADALRGAGVAVFGPGAAAAALEGSKSVTKDLCRRYAIPTAAFESFSDRDRAAAYIRAQGAPIVIKADGLAAGKGVVVAQTVDAALAALDDAMAAPGARVVVEECLYGEEASYFALCDGTHILPLATAQDHKRVGDGDTGPNTGGMGAYSPAPVMTPAMCERVRAEIVAPTVAALAEAGTPFVGVLYAGLMITPEGPKLIEYNVRFGDPECQALMARLDSDLAALLYAAATGDLAGQEVSWRDEAALCVVMAARGYPGPVEKGSAIRGVAEAETTGAMVFHAATARDAGGTLRAAGGRVLGVTALGRTISDAKRAAYEAVDRIDWPEGFCRRDIGAKTDSQ